MAQARKAKAPAPAEGPDRAATLRRTTRTTRPRAPAKANDPVRVEDRAEVKVKAEAAARAADEAGNPSKQQRHTGLFAEGVKIMPGGDRTGPEGMGPMSGRALGHCAGYPTGGFATAPAGGLGRGFGRGMGGRGRGRGGWGRRNRFYATGLTGWQRAAVPPTAYGPAPYGAPGPAATASQESEALEAQAEYFTNALDEIRKRIDELHAESAQKKD